LLEYWHHVAKGLNTPGNWFDATERGDLGGFATDTLKHYEAWFLRRDWSELWFKPIARIGEIGNDEYILEPINPFTPHGYKNNLPAEKDHSQPISAGEATAGMGQDPTPADRKTFSAKITAHKAGELFLYVNDAVLAEPLNAKKFYLNNFGCAQVTVDRLRPDGTLCRLIPHGDGEASPPDETCAEPGKEVSIDNVCGLSDTKVQQ